MHGQASDQVEFDPVAYASAVGERNRSHLYGFGSLQKEGDILRQTSSRTSTSPSTAPAELSDEMKQLFQQWATEALPGILTSLLPGMLNSLGGRPLDSASRANIADPPSSSQQNDIERNVDCDGGGDDDDMEDLR
ncbi:hypothetical protein COLO4_07345 [Corchorus olitorius]|uniref:Uncharacterized protein n=1 Tax=Corchorus olitorius TaxID=93759 RepID=A0A1R3KK53_9ROSI|nr:hypothetical protein COLO4_07345 [Corchorus olitorius]